MESERMNVYLICLVDNFSTAYTMCQQNTKHIFTVTATTYENALDKFFKQAGTQGLSSDEVVRKLLVDHDKFERTYIDGMENPNCNWRLYVNPDTYHGIYISTIRISDDDVHHLMTITY